MNILKSALGQYEVTGVIEDADCVIGHSFGTIIVPGSANFQIAEFTRDHAGDKPIIADRMLVDAMRGGDERVTLPVEGPITNALGKGVGTWGVLLAAKEFMEEEGLRKPLMVAQARHIGRVVMQAQKLGIDSIVPAGLPDVFDKTSTQWGTRNPALWVAHELVGSLELCRRGQL